MQDWLRRVGIRPIRIYPVSPWENVYNERFNGTLRREALNAEWFATARQAQLVIDHWLREYNHIRPHEALGMHPPVPETILRNPKSVAQNEGALHDPHPLPVAASLHARPISSCPSAPRR